MNIEVRRPRARRRRATASSIATSIRRCSIEDFASPICPISGGRTCRPTALRPRHGFTKAYPMPKITPQAARRDAWPPGGGHAGQRSRFHAQAALDLYGIDYGIMNPLAADRAGRPESATSALQWRFAANELQLERWNSHEPRLKASVVVPYEDAEASVAEIKRCAGDKRFAHVFMLSRTAEAHRAAALLADL